MSSPTTATHASRERPLAQGTSRHPSVKQSINCMEACNQQSTCQTLQPDQDWVCRFGCVSFLMEWEGRRVRSCIRSAPPLFRPKDLALQSCAGKEARSAQCCAATVGRLERKPTWSIIPDVSPG